MATRTANIFAVTVEVQCPYCGEPLPSPDNGSDAWMPEQVKSAQGSALKTCNSCDEEFRIVFHGRVEVLP